MLSIKLNTISSGSLDIGGKVFVKGVKEYMEELLYHLPELDPDIEVIKVNVQEDHIHMVVVIPPKCAVARVMQHIK